MIPGRRFALLSVTAVLFVWIGWSAYATVRQVSAEADSIGSNAEIRRPEAALVAGRPPGGR
jgi:hypothetical protein